MPVVVVVVVAAAACALTVWALWFALRDRAVVLRQLVGAGVVEALLLVQAAVAGVLALRGEGPADAVLFWGYVATQAVLLPAAALWAFAERTRWSSVVLAVAAATVAFLQWRLVQIWG